MSSLGPQKWHATSCIHCAQEQQKLCFQTNLKTVKTAFKQLFIINHILSV